MLDNVLVSGANSGLGKYLAGRFGATTLNRNDDPLSYTTHRPFDAIIHCAIDRRGAEDEANHAAIIERNTELTRKLAQIPHMVFVHISSADVYPESSERRDETTPIQTTDGISLYRSIKIRCEEVSANETSALLTLRPVAMLGETARPNSVIRMLRDPDCALTLHPESALNYVLHKDIGDFAKTAITQNLLGIFNVASSDNMRLKDIAEATGSRPTFGTFRYDVGLIDNRKAAAVLPALNRPTSAVIAQFAKEYS